MCRKPVCLVFLSLTVLAAPGEADTLSGLADVTVADGAIVSLRYDGAEYVVADGDLTLGTTTRWYVKDGAAALWAEGDPAPPATASGTSDPKAADVGSNADNWIFAASGVKGGISSIDGIDFMETIFPVLSTTFFVFERGGNDAGTVQAILADGSLGEAVPLIKGAGGSYADTKIGVAGQNAFGLVFTTDVPVQGLRITASGFDALSISIPTPPPTPLVVPMTSVAPVIDGELDGVWHNVAESRCLITDIVNADSAAPENWYDLFGTFKVMYDANNVYIFVAVQDSVIDPGSSSWDGDGVEIFFDGDNSKGDSYDGVNDNQIRITVDDVELAGMESTLPIEGAAFAVSRTDLGYNVEASFPRDVLQIDPNNVFGFEVQINDNDGAGGRETVARWHSDDNDSWQKASLFGLAQFGSRTVGDMLDVSKVAFVPLVDGVMEADWKALPEITCNKYVLSNSDLSKQGDYTDARFSFRVGWDDENLYLFVSVLDDMYYDLATNHTADGIELFFDADNSKAFQAYDKVDDVQLRINHADLTPADIDMGGGPANVTKDNINFVVVDTTVGYDVEIAIPLADLAIPAQSGHVFGFDMFLNDADEAVRDNIRNYWSGNNDNWRYAHLFGEAVLVGGE